MYQGPVIDAFLHTPWIGEEDPADPRGDRVDWSGDRRLQRVMHTFNHHTTDGRPAAALGSAALIESMAAVGVERALLPAKIYDAASEQSVRAVHRQLGRVCEGRTDTLRWGCSLVPPELGPGTY